MTLDCINDSTRELEELAEGSEIPFLEQSMEESMEKSTSKPRSDQYDASSKMRNTEYAMS
jgi:hypothetical protein